MTRPEPVFIIAGTPVDRLERAGDCSVVTANYRTDEVLAECRASLAKTCGGLELGGIVVDDGATLAGGGFRKRFPDVQLVENAGNVGFARAAKLVIGLARGQHVLCVNPDTAVHDGAVAAMVAYLEAHSRVGAVGAPARVRRDPPVLPPPLSWPCGHLSPHCQYVAGDDHRVPRGSRILPRITKRPRAILSREIG